MSAGMSIRNETYEKCLILFKFKEGGPAMAGLTTPEEYASHSTGQAGIHLVFRGLKFEPDPGGIDSVFHRAGAEIGQKGAFCKSLRRGSP